MTGYFQKLRPGTRALWARKLNTDRKLACLAKDEVAAYSGSFKKKYKVSLSTVRRYEKSGPPTLNAARNMQMAINAAVLVKFGGEQLDFEDALSRVVF